MARSCEVIDDDPIFRFVSGNIGVSDIFEKTKLTHR